MKREQPSGELALLSNDQLRFIANTDFVPKQMRGNLPAILACVATGRALGLADMDALRSIHIIDGKATMAAELMVKLARRNGHSIQGDFGDSTVTVRGRRADTGDEMTVTWTTAMAQRAGLLGKSNWKAYPEAMLWARAASQLCRMLFPDCLGGVSYTPEEAELSPVQQIDAALSTTVPVSPGPDDSPAEPAQPAEIIEAEPGGLSAAEFRDRVAGLDKTLVNTAGKEMFPGRAPGTLTDGERLQLVETVEARVSDEAAGREFSFADMVPGRAKGES